MMPTTSDNDANIINVNDIRATRKAIDATAINATTIVLSMLLILWSGNSCTIK